MKCTPNALIERFKNDGIKVVLRPDSGDFHRPQETQEQQMAALDYVLAKWFME